jgi:hypothetical protein
LISRCTIKSTRFTQGWDFFGGGSNYNPVQRQELKEWLFLAVERFYKKDITGL